jgi:hypothetical protein
VYYTNIEKPEETLFFFVFFFFTLKTLPLCGKKGGGIFAASPQGKKKKIKRFC